jgi:hypothetical protein
MTMYDERTNLSRQVVEEVRVHWRRRIQTIIPRNIRLGEAPSHGKPISSTTFVLGAPRRIGTWRRSSCSMKRRALGKGLSSRFYSRSHDGDDIPYHLEIRRSSPVP